MFKRHIYATTAEKKAWFELLQHLIMELQKIENKTQHEYLKIREPRLFGLPDRPTYEKRGYNIRVTPRSKTKEIRDHIGLLTVYLATLHLKDYFYLIYKKTLELVYTPTIDGTIVVNEDPFSQERYSVATCARNKNNGKRMKVQLNVDFRFRSLYFQVEEFEPSEDSTSEINSL